MKEFLTQDELATMAGVSPRTIRRWLRSDGVDVYVVGDRRRCLIRSIDAERLLEPRIVNHGEKRNATTASA